MPFMSPSACFTAWPSAMPTSSVVWWWSMCRSPLALTVMSMREWRASRSSMWSRKPMPVAIVDAPVPSRSTATSMSVSLVLRLTRAPCACADPCRFARPFIRRSRAISPPALAVPLQAVLQIAAAAMPTMRWRFAEVHTCLREYRDPATHIRALARHHHPDRPQGRQGRRSAATARSRSARPSSRPTPRRCAGSARAT